MTRRFGTWVTCPYCKKEHTAETQFERWIRNNPFLDSKNGFVRFDLDELIHKYKNVCDKKGRRDVQCMMFIEVKTNGADLSYAQRDTLNLLNQVMRNRKANIHSEKRGLHAKQRTPPCKAYSVIANQEVTVWLFGGHLLRLSGNDPSDSEYIEWDRKRIDVSTLEQILLFDRDPDTLRVIDWRRRSETFEEFNKDNTLFEMSNITTKLQTLA